MAFMWVAMGTSAVIGAYSASESAKANNEAMSQTQDNAVRRYELQADIAEQQMEEQQGIARDKMTDVTRAFLVAKGKSTAIQAETMVGGNVSQKLEAVERTKYSEAKGKVAKEVDTNVINIANDMLAKQVDTEAIISEAESKKKNVFTSMLTGGVSGAISGYQMGSSISSPTTSVGVKSTGVSASSSTNIFTNTTRSDFSKAFNI